MEDKNFGLTEASFNKMQLNLRKNDTCFFQQVFLQQFKETVGYVKREYGANHEDAHDATMDTLLEFRRRFVECKLQYGNLRFLFTKMSAQMYLRQKKQQDSIMKNIHTIPETSEEDTREEAPESFNIAWKKLGANCKELLTRHFYGAMKLTEIAEEFSESPATIRKQKERCIKKIKDVMLEINRYE